MQTLLILLSLTLVVLAGAYVVILLRRSQAATQDAEQRKMRRGRMQAYLDQLAHHLHMTQTCAGADGRAGVGIVRDGEQLVWVGPGEDGLASCTYAADQIVGADVREHVYASADNPRDDVTPKVRCILLELHVRDPGRAARLVTFLSEDVAVGSDAHFRALEQACHWRALAIAMAQEGAAAGLAAADPRRDRALAEARRLLQRRPQRETPV